MKRENKILEDKLPKNCCTFCSHLSLEGPDENFRYYIKCIIKNSIPKPSDCCEFFSQEHTHLTTCNLDYLYLDFLDFLPQQYNIKEIYFYIICLYKICLNKINN